MMNFQINDIWSNIFAELYKILQTYIDHQFDKFILEHITELEGEDLTLEESATLAMIKQTCQRDSPLDTTMDNL